MTTYTATIPRNDSSIKDFDREYIARWADCRETHAKTTRNQRCLKRALAPRIG